MGHCIALGSSEQCGDTGVLKLISQSRNVNGNRKTKVMRQMFQYVRLIWNVVTGTSANKWSCNALPWCLGQCHQDFMSHDVTSRFFLEKGALAVAALHPVSSSLKEILHRKINPGGEASIASIVTRMEPDKTVMHPPWLSNLGPLPLGLHHSG